MPSSSIALIVFATTFPLARFVGRSFLPTEDQGEFDLTVDAPEGTSLAGMEKLVLGVRQAARRTSQGVAFVMPTIFERVNHSHLIVQLKPIEDRDKTQEEVAMARSGSDAPVRRLPADGRDQDGDRWRREPRTGRSSPTSTVRTCGR